MLFNRTAFIGINPILSHTAPARGKKQRRAYVYAALDHKRELIALGEGSLEDVLAFVAGQESAFVAVSAPRRPNLGLMGKDDLRQTLVPPPKPGRWLDYRLAEYQLRQHRIGVTPTPSREEDCTAWMRSGFVLYHRLEGLDYQAYPCADSLRQYLEVHPHTCYCGLLGLAPFPKETLEGRLQRQLILFDQGLKINDPMEFFEEITPRRLLKGTLPLKEIYSTQELDVIVAAYSGWLAAVQPDQVSLIGSEEEGQILIPVHELKAHY